MTITKRYEVLANGTSMGFFQAAHEVGAIDAYAKDAGYKDIGELCAEIGSSDGEVKAVEEVEHDYWINANNVSMLDREADITLVEDDILAFNFSALPSQLQKNVDEFKRDLLDNLVRSADLTISDYTLNPEEGETVDEQDYDFADVVRHGIDPEVLLSSWDDGYREAKGGKVNVLTPFADACISDNSLDDLDRDNAARASVSDISEWRISPATWARSLGQAYAVKEADEAEDEAA